MRVNPTMVPRVRPEDLEQRDPHEIVKVSLQLDWLISEQAVADLKPMFSPNGKLTQLKATNRLEAIDVVINLREIYSLLELQLAERGAIGGRSGTAGQALQAKVYERRRSPGAIAVVAGD